MTSLTWFALAEVIPIAHHSTLRVIIMIIGTQKNYPRIEMHYGQPQPFVIGRSLAQGVPHHLGVVSSGVQRP